MNITNIINDLNEELGSINTETNIKLNKINQMMHASQ